jgi:hypothetical protein
LQCLVLWSTYSQLGSVGFKMQVNHAIAITEFIVGGMLAFTAGVILHFTDVGSNIFDAALVSGSAVVVLVSGIAMWQDEELLPLRPTS